VSGHPDYNGPAAVGGKDVLHCVGFDTSSGQVASVTYDLGGHYTTLGVRLAIGDFRARLAAHFDVLGDGTSLLSGGVDVSPSVDPIDKTVSVSGVRRLALVTSIQSSYTQTLFCNAQVAPGK